jgi:hypothetical protein
MSGKTFEAVWPNWRNELAREYRNAAELSAAHFAKGWSPTDADLAELRTSTEIQFLKAIGPVMKKQMGSRLVEEACLVASQAFVDRLLELFGVSTLTMKH